MRAMSTIARIRNEVFKVNQAAFAEIAGVTQPTVSRWEHGYWEPSREELERIRSEAMNRGLEWDDSWLFDGPPVPAQPEAAE